MERKSKILELCRKPPAKKQCPVKKLKIAANLDWLYKKKTSSILEQYALAKKSGFKYVEGGFPFKHPIADVVAAKEKAGVEHVMINMFEGDMSKGDLGFAALVGKEDEFCQHFKNLVEYAKALKCPLVHITCGNIKCPNEENEKVLMKNLRCAVEVLKKENLVGLLECINWVVEPNYYLDTFQKTMDIIFKIDSPHLKLMLDIYHLQYNNGNLTCNLEWLIPHTGHLQISQIPGRHEPWSEGEMNYNFIFKLLMKLGYSGYIGLEYAPAEDVDAGLGWLATQDYFEGYEPPSKSQCKKDSEPPKSQCKTYT